MVSKFPIIDKFCLTYLSNGIELLGLPTEILYIIMGTLKIHDLRNLSWTCKLLYHISRKYHFGVAFPVWRPVEISKIDDIPISYYRDGVWINDTFYLPIFHTTNPVCWILDLSKNLLTWSQKPLIVDPNSKHRYEPIRSYASKAIKNFIYVFGGENIIKGTTTNIFYELNAYTFELRVLNEINDNIPSSRMMHTLDAIDNNRLAIFGGRSLIIKGNKTLAFDRKDFAIYNIKTKKWTCQESNIYRRSLHNSYIMNEKLYIYGGQKYKCFSNYSQIHDDEDISVYDFRKEKWYKLLNLPTSNGNIISKMLLPTSWTLTKSNNRKPTPGKRMYSAMFATNNRIAILGGSQIEDLNNEEISRPWELMYLLSTLKYNWEYIRIKNFPQIEVLTFYWKSWNIHEGLFLIGKDKKEDKLIMGWIRDSIYVENMA